VAAQAIRSILKQRRNPVVSFGSGLRGLAWTSRPLATGCVAVLVTGMALLVGGCTSLGPTFPQPAHYSPQYRQPAGIGNESGSGGRVVTASWYGSEFAGRHTASGERFNPNEMTAASKTLPIGSVVRVTNPKNGKSVVVRINDRGPYVRGRSIDLSRSAAQKLGIAHKGVARVKIKKMPTRTDTARASLY
jgi:hypothetical protein